MPDGFEQTAVVAPIHPFERGELDGFEIAPGAGPSDDLGLRARLDADLNLQELARLTGLSIGALSQIETGKRDVRLTTLVRIAVALRLAPATLLGAPAGDQVETSVEAPLADPEGYDLGDYE
jgi:DNA-binding Xre family transcriptional regulator